MGRSWLPVLIVLSVTLSVGCVGPYHGFGAPARSSHEELSLDSDKGDSSNSQSAPVRRSLSNVPSVHTVASGENLYRIALRYGITVDELRQANDINDVKNLRVGQTLKLPARLGTRTVQTEEVASATAPMVVSNPSVMRPYENGIAQRTLDSRSSATYGKGSLEWPLRGVLYGRYGRRGREMHDGVDLAAPLGTPIKTAAPGMVLFAGEQRGYGLIVVVEHEQGLVTLYAHNRDLRVRAGQKVRDGQVIATVGESGKTSGPHLHFEVRERGKAVDPLPRLGPAPRN